MIITREEFEELKREYRSAVFDDKEKFNFKGAELYTPFAKYLIEYLSDKFK